MIVKLTIELEADEVALIASDLRLPSPADVSPEDAAQWLFESCSREFSLRLDGPDEWPDESPAPARSSKRHKTGVK